MKKIKFNIKKELKLKLQEMNLILAGSGREPLPSPGGGCTNCLGLCEVTCSNACSSSCTTRCTTGCGNVLNL